MRLQFLFALFFTAIVGGTYWYQTTAYLCPIPLAYRIGDIDPEFLLTKEAAQAQVEKAELLWETAAGKELFYYDENATLTVNFEFDARQAAADSEYAQRAELDEQKSEHEAVLATVSKLQGEYENLAAAYEEKVVAYQERLSAYNAEVNSYNDRGGAPANTFAALEAEREALNAESTKLNAMADDLQTFATELNEVSERGNALVDSYNRAVERYNDQFGFAREFTQGDYQTNRVTIYKFSSDAELQTVLAHELGHALGIAHVEGDDSVMYYLLEEAGEAPQLSADDIAALAEVCGDDDSFTGSLRRTIRATLSMINI